MTIQERCEAVAYFTKMRDDSRAYMRVFLVGRQDEARDMWAKRAEMCDLVVKALTAIECPA